VQLTSVSYNYLDDFLTEIRSSGRHSFSLEELKRRFPVSGKALNQALFRLKSKNRIIQIRKEFYAILSPQFIKQASIPPELFVDDMMKALKKRYCDSSPQNLHLS